MLFFVYNRNMKKQAKTNISVILTESSAKGWNASAVV
jgi:hypothetical protein